MRIEGEIYFVSVAGKYFEDIWIAVIGFRFKVTTKNSFWIRYNKWVVKTVIIAHKKRRVVAKQFSKKTGCKKEEEEYEAVIAPSVAFKSLPSPVTEAIDSFHD